MEEFARAVLSKNVDVDVLINNAGIMFGPRAETDDGHESQFGVNHLVRLFLTVLGVHTSQCPPRWSVGLHIKDLENDVPPNDLHTFVVNEMCICTE